MCVRGTSTLELRSEAAGAMFEAVHQRQRYSWDCGVTCVLMVLPKCKRQHLLDNFAAVCGEEGFGRSTWTIDLCYLLRRYEVAHSYCTVTLGVHPGYHGRLSFYEGIAGRDADRVAGRFAGAAAAGLNVQRRRVPLEEVLRHLDSGKPAILLTNARLLRCDRCKINRLSLELRQCLPVRWPPPAYLGHYVLLCGHGTERARLYYRNPALHDHVCSMDYDSLDIARRCYGTDEDIIFIGN